MGGRVITTPIDTELDSDGIPMPSALPDEALDDIEQAIDMYVGLPNPVTSVEETIHSVEPLYTIHSVEPLYSDSQVDTIANDKSRTVEVENSGPGTMPQFQADLINKQIKGHLFQHPFANSVIGGHGSPVIDSTVPAPPPINVGLEPFEDVDLDPPFGESGTPLVSPLAADDESTTPLFYRETKIDHALCRTCKKCMETVHGKPLKSQSFTGLQISLQCGVIKGKLYDVTEALVYHCSWYEHDETRKPKPFAQIATEIRKRFGLTAPPLVKK